MYVTNVSDEILKVFSRSRSWGAQHKHPAECECELRLEQAGKQRGSGHEESSREGCPAGTPTWNMAYMMQVSGRLWEYLATLKMLRPHLFRSSSSFGEHQKKKNNGLNGFTINSAFPQEVHKLVP